MRTTRDYIDQSGGRLEFGKTVQFRIDPGPSIAKLTLVTNLNNDQIDQVLISLNGEGIFDLTGEQVRSWHSIRGGKAESGVFVIDYRNRRAKTPVGDFLNVLQTQPGDNLVLKIKIADQTSAQQQAGVTPEIRVLAEYAPNSGVRKTLPRVFSTLWPAGAVGRITYNQFQRGPRVRGLHLLNPALRQLEIRRDGLTRFQRTAADNVRDLEDSHLPINPESGVFSFLPACDGYFAEDVFQTASSRLEFIYDVDQAGDFPVVIDLVEILQA